MDILQLRLWFMRVRQSYKKSVKVIKVNLKGHKFVRTIRIEDEVGSIRKSFRKM